MCAGLRCQHPLTLVPSVRDVTLSWSGLKFDYDDPAAMITLQVDLLAEPASQWSAAAVSALLGRSFA